MNNRSEAIPQIRFSTWTLLSWISVAACALGAAGWLRLPPMAACLFLQLFIGLKTNRALPTWANWLYVIAIVAMMYWLVVPSCEP